MNKTLYACLLSLLSAMVLGAPQRRASGSDWTDWRGPTRDGICLEKGLPTEWSLSGENLAWKAPYGGRSGPIVVGDRVFIQNSVGRGETLQERVVCLNADNGRLIWEHRFNIYLSDVPPHRVGWASPVGDPVTGNVYAFGVGGTLLGLSNEGKLLWERSLPDDFGLITTHGGRTVSPVIEGDLVIVSGLTSGWGNQARAGHRFIAFDKKTGETVWVSSPGGRPYDTTYSPPIARVINGTRLLIAGGGDGAVHALKPQTGEPVWRYEVSKRGLNTGIVLKDSIAIVTHSEENLDTNEMGFMAAIDASATGDIGKQNIKWSKTGFQGGFSTPVIDGDRIYQIDNGSNLVAFDFATGKQLWTLNLGTIQKASPVLGDGKLYVGTENGKFFILRPGAERCEVLDEDQLGTEGAPEAIIASVAISRGRVFLVSSDATYCIGKKSAPLAPPQVVDERPGPDAEVAHVQVVPTEIVIKPGEQAQFRAKAFDRHGRFIRETPAAWSLEQLQGQIEPSGRFTPNESGAQAGHVKAAVGQVTGVARVRVVPPLPWSETFDSLPGNSVPRQWINATGKFVSREIDGNRVLVKLADNPATKRARVYMGPSNLSNYTVQSDVFAIQKRRQMGDAGVVAQRYALILFGNHERLELESWQPETSRTVRMPFAWKPNAWYRMKLQVENLADGRARARGKVWPAAESEPAAWMIERIDPIGNKQGSPGLYADVPSEIEIFFDNLKVTPNK